MHFSTKAIHTGIKAEEETGALMPPIYMTSTYQQQAPGVTKGYDYTRAGNPNFTIVEKQLAALEEGIAATIFSSGLGALTALLSTLKQGDTVLAFEGLYGGTYRLLDKVFSNFGIHYHLVNESNVEKNLSQKPALLLFETPNNPLLTIHDIAWLCQLAKKANVLSVVDNTFASPYFQRPLTLGADIVWESSTKYIGGHSDIIGGALITNSKMLKDKFDFARMALGLNPSPFDAWLLSRSIKTLPLRMQKHGENASKIAKYLETAPLVKKVYYPGLATHPKHDIAKKQMSGFSGIISVEFDLDLDKTKELISKFKIFALAESLGGIESLVCHPATMTHVSIPQNLRKQMGIQDNLVRFSIGLEDADDLINDLRGLLS